VEQTLKPNPFFVTGAKIIASRPVTFLLDPFIPRLFNNYLAETLEKWKTKGLLTSYRFRVVRLSRLTYKIEVHILVSKEETKKMIQDYINQLLGPALKNFV